jgi:transcriptional regulator with XRE-family HTH domain
MKPKSFSQLYREAERHQDYWIAGAILEFTESVVREMARQRLTRTALAERLGTTPAYVTKILRGKVNFTLATMVRLSRALSVDLHVRLGADSRREIAQAIEKSIRAPTVQASPCAKIAATASRPAALQTRHRAAGKTVPGAGTKSADPLRNGK